MISVYIASPYTIGNKEENVTNSFYVYNKLYKLGFMPFAPLTGHYIDKEYPLPYDGWLEIDLHWLSKCDCVLRLPGESRGADMEVEKAIELNMMVFHSIDDMLKHYTVKEM